MTSDSFVSTVTCTEAIYSAVQSVTSCSNADLELVRRSKTETIALQNLNPYCTNYHTQTYSSQNSLSTVPRSGLYYFLVYTMQEVPLAWWHKCMLLQVTRKTETETKTETGTKTVFFE